MSAKHLADQPGLTDRLRSVSKRTRKMIAVICAVAVIGAGIPAVVFSVGAKSDIYASTTDFVNLRTGAGTNYNSLTVVPKNETVTVTDRSNPQWLKVKLSDGTAGYICADYLDIVTDGSTNTYLNFRESADTSSKIIKTLAPQTSIDILSFCGSNWAYVRLSDNSKGYVCTDYIDFVNQDSSDNSSSNQSSNTSNTSSGASNTSSASSSEVKMTISTKARKLAVGNSCVLTATTSSGGSIEWKSLKNSVASVDSNGKVTGISEGTAVVYARDKRTNKTITCTLTVVKTDINFINLSTRTLSLEAGNTYNITASTTPKGNESLIKYRSADTSVATVSSAGKIKAVSAGTIWVTCYDPTDTVTASVRLTVKNSSTNNSSASAETPAKTVTTTPAETKKTPTITISKTSATFEEGANVCLTAKLSDGSAVKWSTSNAAVASVKNGVVSGLKAGSATITASDSTGNVTASCKVTVSSVSSSGISVSRSSASTNQGKTLYIKGYCSRSAKWGTSDSNIATVSEGFVYGKSTGRVAITYTDNYGNRAICVVTVGASDSIKFTYSSPNSATVNSTVKLIAITDQSRKGVRFTVFENGYRKTVDATSKVTEGSTYVWTANYKVTSAGVHSYIAYANNGSTWATCNAGKADIWVTNKKSSTTTGLDRLRASDEVIRFIGNWEGFVSDITYDTLANNIPTIAHGYVVWEGESFYNHMTKGEGYALLVKAVNDGAYSSRVNDMLIEEQINFNQQQFDALVSLSYNIGTGWSYSSDIKTILLNSYGPSTSSSSTVYGTVSANGGLNLRKSYSTSSDVIRVLNDGEIVTLVSTQKYNSVWYKVKTSKNETGYVSGTYLNLSTSGAKARDLNYVNKNALINELLAYHHAGGVCYYGLLYRRCDELEMFFYGDYANDGYDNKYGFPSPYCLSF